MLMPITSNAMSLNPYQARCTQYNICDQVCEFCGFLWALQFTDCHNITEIWLKVALYTITLSPKTLIMVGCRKVGPTFDYCFDGDELGTVSLYEILEFHIWHEVVRCCWRFLTLLVYYCYWNFTIFPSFFMNRTLKLKIIGQWDVKQIMTLPIKPMTSVLKVMTYTFTSIIQSHSLSTYTFTSIIQSHSLSTYTFTRIIQSHSLSY